MIAWLGVLTPVVVALAAFAVWLARLLWRTLQQTIHFLDDYSGQPARDGAPGRPGVMARLAALETLAQKISRETQPNGGASMRDSVSRIERDVADVKDEQARLRTQIELRQPPEGK